mgnify:CR=1 FL=1
MNAVPQHIAIIMDGNGRWAQQRRRPRVFGHQVGRENVDRIVALCSGLGVKTLSLFAFSCENWQRPAAEVALLMQLIKKDIDDSRDKLHRENVRVQVLGERANLSAELQDSIARIEAHTAANDGLQLVLAINYSGQWEILATVWRLLAAGLRPEQLNEEVFAQHRPLALPPVDLLIRTSGEQRLSNFFLWEAAYAELYFCDVHWPAFGEEQLEAAIAAYQQRQRRFGTLEEE